MHVVVRFVAGVVVGVVVGVLITLLFWRLGRFWSVLSSPRVRWSKASKPKRLKASGFKAFQTFTFSSSLLEVKGLGLDPLHKLGHIWMLEEGLNGGVGVGQFCLGQEGMNLSVTDTVQLDSHVTPFGFWDQVMGFDVLLWNFSFAKGANDGWFDHQIPKCQAGLSFDFTHETLLHLKDLDCSSKQLESSRGSSGAWVVM